MTGHRDGDCSQRLDWSLRLTYILAMFASFPFKPAQSCSCTVTVMTNRVSLEQIQSHFRDFSQSLNQEVCYPLPQDCYALCTAARLYKGLVNTRIPPNLSTKIQADHKDFNFTKAQVGYANEVFHDGTAKTSVDDINKVNVGAQVVSRFFHVNKVVFSAFLGERLLQLR